LTQDFGSQKLEPSLNALLPKVAILLVSCALVGFLLGRLIRGRQPAIERARPRLAISSAYLRDAHNDRVSNLTRYRCAFEAIYFCLSEVAETHGVVVEGKEHPSNELLCAGLAALGASAEDQKEVALLAKWAAATSVTLPGISIQEACKLAVRVNRNSVALLSSSTTQ
jgi:hypothetical protein